MSITRTLAAALAIGALAVPAAQAQPADIHAPLARAAAEAQNKQDLRSADARDAAQHPRGAAAGESTTLPGPPTWPAHPKPLTPAPVAEAGDGGTGITWTTIGLGIAGSLLAVSGLAALTTRRSRRLQRLRAAA
jgi:hypothetical protein